jgi:hypothetical protein
MKLQLQLVLLQQLISELLILFNAIVYIAFYELYVTALKMSTVIRNMLL